jgi:hypothetical protein
LLKLVEQALFDAGLVSRGVPIQTNLIFKGPILFVDALCNDGAQFHLRLSESVDFSAEYAVSLDAARRFPRNAPFPLGRGVVAEFSWIAYEGLDLRPIRPRTLVRASRGSPVFDGLIRFCLDSAKQTVDFDEAFAKNRDVISRRSEGLHGVPDSFLDQGQRLLDLATQRAVRNTMQHGDFALNNLATSGHKLIVYDWEDFGKVALAGFDIAVVLASAHDFDPSKLVRYLRRAQQDDWAGRRQILNAACGAAGVPSSTFVELMPLYLLMFLALKAPPYSQTVRDKVRAALAEVGNQALAS